MVSSNHDQSVIFLDHDDNNIEANENNRSDGEDDQTEKKKIKAARSIFKQLSFHVRNRRTGRGVVVGPIPSPRIGSYFRNGLDKKNPRNAAAANSSSSKSDEVTPTLLPGLDQLEDLITKAEYECTQDPYRGIGWLRQRQQTVQDQHSAIEKQKEDVPVTAVDTAPETATVDVLPPATGVSLMLSSQLSSATPGVPGRATATEKRLFRKVVSPWDACQWGILTAPKTSFDMVADMPEKQQSTSLETQPENRCNPEVALPSDKCSIQLEPNNPENLVRHLTESSCPSLLAWTKQRIEQDAKTLSQQNRKRKPGKKRGRSESDTGADSSSSSPPPPPLQSLEVHLGQRPSNIRYRCPCDSNPFCLASLGGVMNDILMERCQSGIAIAIDDDDHDDSNTVDDAGKDDGTGNGKRPKSECRPLPLLRTLLDAPKTVKSVDAKDRKNGDLCISGDAEDSVEGGHGGDDVIVVDADVIETPTQNEDSHNESTHRNVIASADAVAVPVREVGTDVFEFMDDTHATKIERDINHPGGTKTTAAIRAAHTSPLSAPTKPTRTIITCKRLATQRSKLHILGEGEAPGDIFSHRDNDERITQHLNETTYSRGTQEELERLRTHQVMEIARIDRYVRHILEKVHANERNDNEDKETLLSLDQYMQAIADWHKSLLFVSPIKQERQHESHEITIALPPGIQNLGATCYLNTQLQCLAQIPAFLDGIFSWRVVNSNHNMNPVMTKLQKLLANMLVGGERKMSTQDFSDALGLEHNEQQDPNEFGRLLFDRMEESFQQCSGLGSSDRDSSSVVSDGDLAHLLERIFRGTTTYETRCMNCGNTSARSEDFTDLNLPIVRRPSEVVMDSTNEDAGNELSDETVRTKRRITGTIDEAFANYADTDVQYCFDKYATAEVLDGDNQYHCSNCDSKQDAERVLRLTKLPPVLNVQLSRYVFDRVKFVKKKLMNKVLLPTTLTIGRQILDNPTDSLRPSNERKYTLCAVMRHQGTSAYSGHYIAEAMDWTTGLWYEFNDETVKVLPRGPSCSYNPGRKGEDSLTCSDSDGTENETRNFWNGSQEAYEGMVGGSQDAYNMYYVDECYLATNAVNAVSKRLTRLLSTSNGENQSESGVLREVVEERKMRYSVLSEMCFTDWHTSDRLRRRKLGIRKYMFRDPSSLLWQDDENMSKETYYWVEGDTLRSFLACSPAFDDRLRSRESLVCPESFLCSHGGLHPRTARRGKVLRKGLYDAYVSLLRGERQLLRDTSAESHVSDVVGHVIEASSNLFCTECVKSYGIDLSKKLEYVKAVKDLYFALEEEESAALDKSQLNFDASNEGCPEEHYAYVLSRSSTTNFKRKAAALIKSVAGFDEGGPMEESASSSTAAPRLSGLDDIDIESFQIGVGASSFTQCMEIPKTQCTNEIEKKFNGNITCMHGNSNDSHNKRLVRYVPWKVWALVRKVFPDAIEHRKLRMSCDENNGKPILDDDGCSLCQKEKDLLKSLKSGIETWARETRDNRILKKLLDGNRTLTREIAVHNFTCAQSGCRLVHCDDISNWRKMVISAGKACKRKSNDSEEFRIYIENIAFPNYHSVVLEFERKPIERLLHSLRSLICREHKLVMKSSIFQEHDEDDSDSKGNQLSTNIVVLSDEEHNAYVWSLSGLLTILNEDIEDSHAEDYAYKTGNDIQQITRCSYHPAITRRPESKGTMTDNVIVFTLDGSSKEFFLATGVCTCENCLKEFGPLQQQKQSEQDDYVDNVSEDSKERSKSFEDSKMGSLASDPIVVESDTEEGKMNTQQLRVFEFKAESSIGDATYSLQITAGSSSICEAETQSAGFLRRSTRKRKTRYPTGCILREDSINVSLEHNMAALRLLLYEKCEVPLAGSALYIVNLNNGEPWTIDIPITSNEKSLLEIVDPVRPYDLDSFENIMILYQKLEKDESDVTLWDSLIQASNLDISKQSRNSKGTRKRQSERGFQGTLLQSSSSVAASNKNEAATDMDESVSSKAKKRARADTIEVSEEEKDDRIQSEFAPEDKNEVLTDSSDDSVTEKNVGNHHQPSPDPDSEEKSDPREPKDCFSLSNGVSGFTEKLVNQKCLRAEFVVQDKSLRCGAMDRTNRDEVVAVNRPQDWPFINHQNASSDEHTRLAIDECNGNRLNRDDAVGEDPRLNREDMEGIAGDDEASTPSRCRSASPEKDTTPSPEQADKMNYISELASRLQKAANTPDQGICWDAVTWSIEKNLNRDEQEILDCAYAKLLTDLDAEEQIGDSS